MLGIVMSITQCTECYPYIRGIIKSTDIRYVNIRVRLRSERQLKVTEFLY